MVYMVFCSVCLCFFHCEFLQNAVRAAVGTFSTANTISQKINDGGGSNIATAKDFLKERLFLAEKDGKIVRC